MNREKIVNQVKTLLRSTSFTDADIVEARAQIVREDIAASDAAKQPFIERAIKQLRRGDDLPTVDAALHAECQRLGLDSFDIAVTARAHLEKLQAEAWTEAVQLCRDGADTYAAIDVLMKKYGFAWFDAQQVAARAKAKAAEPSRNN